MGFRLWSALLCPLLFAAPVRAGEFSPVTFTNLQSLVAGAWMGEPAQSVNDRGEIIGGGNEAKYWSPALAGTVIPTLGGAYNSADSLNALGKVVGSSQIEPHRYTDSMTQLFTWTPAGGVRAIGALPGGRHIGARKVNARGDIIGTGDYPGQGYGGYGEVSFLWTEAGGFEVLQPPADGIDIFPADLNDQGQIVGDYGRGTDAYDVSYHAFLREPDGTFRFLGFPGEYWSCGSFVNSAGQVAGVFNPDGGAGHVHAFLWSPETGPVDLGQLTEGDYVDVRDFSETGHMVGASWSGAWFWSPETGMVGIPTTGGSYNVAAALNDFDQVVGWSRAAGDRVSEAFVWSPASGTAALPSPEAIQGAAGDINNHGRIVGYTMPVDTATYGWYTIPVLWTIPDPAPQGDIISRLIARVQSLRDGGVIARSEAVLLLQALESALPFRDGGKAAQAGAALDRFSTHVRQLMQRNALDAAVGNELIDLAQQAIRQLGEEPKGVAVKG